MIHLQIPQLLRHTKKGHSTTFCAEHHRPRIRFATCNGMTHVSVCRIITHSLPKRSNYTSTHTHLQCLKWSVFFHPLKRGTLPHPSTHQCFCLALFFVKSVFGIFHAKRQNSETSVVIKKPLPVRTELTLYAGLSPQKLKGLFQFPSGTER